MELRDAARTHAVPDVLSGETDILEEGLHPGETQRLVSNTIRGERALLLLPSLL